MYFVYILQCSDKSLYIGYTNNLDKRVLAHNGSRRGARYTKTRRPVILKYSEKFRTLSRALKREYELKTWPRKKKLELINKIK
ncbi:hypothetical protein A3B18_02065 [Candidatus Giovannonibacteria bacterium RIFCSPLOWO2_01_FULL_46_13]|uniref:GIY-YIG domain-containing protein n=1 Tax=Candidatus Giovannonibacteria bacterium RIFCSPLOWO2_01_FULL_46_13 TaxID=1798352 RepID=A0A1F5X603_9BACT|nr:MAG: hypothetical protein A3B18_02065 [Candidatus Giovannonibacteria bacterium RIFCSPLOWO2_01_FULL_46_13]